MPRPYLTTHRPSPTTALYTVSTSPPRLTLPSRLLHNLHLATRLLLILLTLLLLLLKTLPPTTTTGTTTTPALHTLHTHLSLTPWPHLLPPTLLLLYLLLQPPTATDSLLVLRSLGIQTASSSSLSFLLPPSSRFIPTRQIRDVFIAEAFRGFEVRYYLAVVVEGEAEVVVVFPGVLPGRAVLEEVWRGLRECLYEDGGVKKGGWVDGSMDE